MIKTKLVLPMIVLAASLVGCTTARTEYGRGEYSRYSGDVADNYCHQSFEPMTLGGGTSSIFMVPVMRRGET